MKARITLTVCWPDSDLSRRFSAWSASGSASDGASEQFGYTLSDRDGDTQSSTLTIDIQATQVLTGTTLLETITGGAGVDMVMGREG